ncbi:endonuclease/exonuclease/phosphatase family protein, partial [Vibrio makurazakiensis]
MKLTFVIRLLSVLFAIGFSYTSFSQTLKISTWNIEWLTIHPQNAIQQSQRQPADFSTLSQYFGKLESDVLAFQEVDSVEAIKNIVGDEYSVVLSDRAQSNNVSHQFKDIN